MTGENGMHSLEGRLAITALRSGKPVERLKAGQNGANVSSRPDGKYGYVAVTGKDAVAVVAMESLEVETWLDVGEDLMGLIVP